MFYWKCIKKQIFQTQLKQLTFSETAISFPLNTFIRSVLCALEHLDVICIEIVLDMKKNLVCQIWLNRLLAHAIDIISYRWWCWNMKTIVIKFAKCYWNSTYVISSKMLKKWRSSIYAKKSTFRGMNARRVVSASLTNSS